MNESPKRSNDESPETERNPERTDESLWVVSRDVSSSVGGALVGLAIGGPAGAVVGAAAGPLVAFADEALERRRRKAAAVLKLARPEDPDGLLSDLRSDPSKLDLAARVLAAAADSSFNEKLTALAKVLAAVGTGVVDELDRFYIVVRILDSLDGADIRVLKFIATSKARGNQEVLTPEDLLLEFPDLALGMRAVVRRLELHGLILDEARHEPAKHGGAVFWKASEIGHECLALLATQSDEAAPENEQEAEWTSTD